ncbi:unnamed protein product [Nesidiocoris tenuis]|uniref:Uncharacterized protein n=1 Tax=Nesidiocoris tenuis TaxID=355587 RepID=A0A6H5HJH0_9HEMI|nr:unnamed protein product [Nesidiocoris tenuis]
MKKSRLRERLFTAFGGRTAPCLMQIRIEAKTQKFWRNLPPTIRRRLSPNRDTTLLRRTAKRNPIRDWRLAQCPAPRVGIGRGACDSPNRGSVDAEKPRILLPRSFHRRLLLRRVDRSREYISKLV